MDRQVEMRAESQRDGVPGLSRWVLCLVPLLTLGPGLIVLNAERDWGSDYNQFYSASKLTGTGDLYDPDAIRAEQLKRRETAVPFGRLPVFAFAFKAVSWLPYQVGRLLWMTVSFAAMGAVIWMWQFGPARHAAALFGWSLPAFYCLNTGQDTLLFLLFAMCGYLLLERGREFTAGLVLSLCLAKFHLGLGIAILLLAQKRWRTILGGAAGGLALLAASFAVEGPEWITRLIELSKDPEFTLAPYRMPNISGMTSWLPHSLYWEAALSAALLAATWLGARKMTSAGAFALALAAGLACGRHAYVYDAVLMLPLVAQTASEGMPRWLKLSAVAISSPFFYFGLLFGPASAPIAHFLLGTFLVVATAVLLRAERSGRDGTVPLSQPASD